MASVSTELNTNGKNKIVSPGFWVVLSSNIYLRSFVFSSILYFSIVMGGWPTHQIYPILIISIGMGLLSAFVYGKIAGLVQAEKGLYFYIKSKLGHYPAFIVTLLIFVFTNLTMGYIISFFPKMIVSDLSFIAGKGYDNIFLTEIASRVIEPQIVGIIGVFFVVAAYISTSFSKYDFPRIYIFSLIFLALIGIILIVQIAFPIVPDFDSSRLAFFAENNRQQMLNIADEHGLSNYIQPGVMGFASLAIVMWFFMIGVENINLNQYVSKKNTLWANIVSVFIIGLFFVLLVVFLQKSVGFDWLQAQAFLNSGDISDIRSWITTIAGSFSPHPIYFGIIIFSQFFVNFVILGTCMVSTGVFVSSWAEDGVFTNVVLFQNRINNKQGIPLLVASIFISFGILFSSLSSSIADIVGLIFVMLFLQIPILVSILLKNKYINNNNSEREGFLIKSGAFLLLISIIFSLGLVLITPLPTNFNPWIGVSIGVLIFLFGSIYYFLWNQRK